MVHNQSSQELIQLQQHIVRPPSELFTLLTLAVQPVIQAAEISIKEEVETVGKLSSVASSSPYYKYA